MSNQSNLLVDDMRRELRDQGITVIWPDTDIPAFVDIDGDLVKSAILPLFGATSEFCAIWCNETEDTHFTPCEGEWDFAGIAGIDEYCPIKSLTIAQGADGSVAVEIAWKDYEYTKLDMYREQVEDGLGRAIGRVLATIRHNREQHA